MTGPVNGSPWHNHDAERRVMSALLCEPDRLGPLGDTLQPADLYHEPYRHLLEALRTLYARGSEITLVTVGAALGLRLDAVGGSMFLTNLAFDFLTAVGFDAHVAIVAEHARRRRVIRALTDAATAGYDREAEFDAWLEAVERDVLAAVRERGAGRGPRDVLQIGVGVLEGLTTGAAGATCASTGFVELDRQLDGGMREGELWVCGARPGMGKTSFALQVASWVAGLCASQDRGRVLVCSLEMLAEALVRRLLADREATLGEIRRGGLTPAKVAALSRRFLASHHPGRLFVDDRPAGLAQIASECRRLGGVRLLVVDYLQLMRAGGTRGASREQVVSEQARGLKEIAKEQGCAVLCLAQLNRQVEARQDRRPMLADLKESGDVEAAADGVLMLYRDEYYRPETEDRGIAEVIVAKQRDGATGTVRLAFVADHVRFANLASDGWAPRPEPERSGDGGGRW